MPSYEIDGIVPVVGSDTFVHPTAVLIGDVIIGNGCYIGPLASLRGDFGRIVVGAGSNVQDGCVLHSFPGRDLVLDPGSHIAHGVVLHGCTVGSGAMVGMNSVVMDGARIGAGGLVGAGSFVPADLDVPAGHLVAGSPAKVIRELDEQTAAWQANGVAVYQELASRSLATLREVEPRVSVEVDRRRVSTDRGVSAPLHELRRAVVEGRTR
ncbi:gamma carbonic anhydrase family protein [Rhodococcus globerulus]|uniref:gamma carbonic anhydrase family protein n=1 Tax=Rhodococcus globerulus TaxID=33008 RepID=UPI0030196BA2